MSDCLFCRIVGKEIQAKIVYEDDHTLAFDDINPQAPVHVLVIPKRHLSSVQEMSAHDQSLLAHVFLASTKVATQKGLDAAGYRLVTNTGRDGGQTVFHMHVHILGGRHMSWPPG
ncbi:putative HIT-like protein [Nitrospira sp. KM1]|uniref:histidine triad nucleotide-binding protein n=1 Tax=Nitrospira sp. KM1 TaxID=1936990 RepID=UPI0013A7734F|nr:histidine triad nucleotide-binding protein [Nitrospira sp. KM1]BCA53569.1 putative HIT-like protein [Nitrospira sp. KM1]